MDHTMTATPTMTWVTVTDRDGREHLEARWLDAAAAHAPSVVHAA